MRHYLFLTVFFLSSTSLFAQTGYLEGYYITPENERIEGLILHRDILSTPQSFKFMLDEHADARTIKISDATEVKIGELKYLRYVVDIDRSSEKVEKLSTTGNPIYKEEELMLQVLLEGGSSLFRYRSPDVTRYFYSEGGHIPVQLVYKSYLDEAEEGLVEEAQGGIRINKGYRQQLLNLYRDIGISNADVIQLRYTASALTQFFQRINSINKISTVLFEDKLRDRRIKFRGKIGTILQNASIKAEGPFGNRFNQKFLVDPVLVFGGNLDYYLGAEKRNLAVYLEFTRYKFKGREVLEADNGPIFNETFTVSTKGIDLAMGIKYNLYSSGDLALTMSGGVINYFEERYDFSYETRVEGVFKKSDRFTYSFGVGLEFQRLSFDAKYYGKRKAFATNLDTEFGYTGLVALIGYRL